MVYSKSKRAILEAFGRSDCKCIVVSFQGNRRTGTYAGLNAFHALLDIAQKTAHQASHRRPQDMRHHYIVFREPGNNPTSWDFEDWKPCIEDARTMCAAIFKV